MTVPPELFSTISNMPASFTDEVVKHRSPACR
jgi:hypothetical protein